MGKSGEWDAMVVGPSLVAVAVEDGVVQVEERHRLFVGLIGRHRDERDASRGCGQRPDEVTHGFPQRLSLGRRRRHLFRLSVMVARHPLLRTAQHGSFPVVVGSDRSAAAAEREERRHRRRRVLLLLLLCACACACVPFLFLFLWGGWGGVWLISSGVRR